MSSTVFRVEKKENFTVISNFHLRDPRLSLRAKGLLGLMLSLPPEWDYTIRGLECILQEGKCAISTALRELEKCGYLEKRQLRAEGGRFGQTEYLVFEEPSLKEQLRAGAETAGAQEDRKQQGQPAPLQEEGEPDPNRAENVENTALPPYPDFRNTGNQPQINKDIKNKDIKNNKRVGGSFHAGEGGAVESEKTGRETCKDQDACKDQDTNRPVEGPSGMTRKEFAIICAAVEAFYLANPLKDPKKKQAYFRGIQGMSYGEAKECLIQHVKTCRFAPTVDELRGEMLGADSESAARRPRPSMSLTPARKAKIDMIRQKAAELGNVPDSGTPGLEPEGFSFLVAAIKELYAKNTLHNKAIEAVWYEVLKDCDFQTCMDHLLAHAAKCPYVPTVAEIRGEPQKEACRNPAQPPNRFSNFHQRDYDFEELEKLLLAAD